MTQLQAEGPTGAETAAGALGARSIATGLPAPTKSLLLSLAPPPPLASPKLPVWAEKSQDSRERGGPQRGGHGREQRPQRPAESRWRKAAGARARACCSARPAGRTLPAPEPPQLEPPWAVRPSAQSPPGSLQGLPQAPGCPHQKPRAQPRRHPGLCSPGWGSRPALPCPAAAQARTPLRGPAPAPGAGGHLSLQATQAPGASSADRLTGPAPCTPANRLGFIFAQKP